MNVIHSMTLRIGAHHVAIAAVVVFDDLTAFFQRTSISSCTKEDAFVPAADCRDVLFGKTRGITMFGKGFGVRALG